MLINYIRNGKLPCQKQALQKVSQNIALTVNCCRRDVCLLHTKLCKLKKLVENIFSA